MSSGLGIGYARQGLRDGLRTRRPGLLCYVKYVVQSLVRGSETKQMGSSSLRYTVRRARNLDKMQSTIWGGKCCELT